MAGDPCVASTLRAVALFTNLSDTALDRIAERSRLERRKGGSELFRQGEEATAFYIVNEGWVKLVRGRPDGRAVLLTTFAPGETFAEAVAIIGGRYPATAIAATDVVLTRIDADALRDEIRAQPEIGFAMIVATAQYLQHMARQIEQLKLQSGDERVVQFLIELAHAEAGPADIDLPFDKRVIAEALGMAQETLSRAFARLRSFGVEVEGSHVHIQDIGGLRARIERRSA